MTVITGFSNKKYFELIANGGELKVIISKEDYEVYRDYEKYIGSLSPPPVIQLGEPWEIIVNTIYSLGGNISYKQLENDNIEATVYLNLSDSKKTMSGYK